MSVFDRLLGRRAATAVAEPEPAPHHLDPTTGLPDRTMIHARAEGAIDQLAEGERSAIVLLDVEGFQLLNNSFGHAAGDEVLRAVAERMSASVREGDLVARVGGDEFAVLCECIRSTDEVTNLARRLLAAMATPFTIHDQQVYLGARVGIAVSGRDTTTLVDLVRDADTAMARAKNSSLRWAIFQPEMRERSRRFLAMASDLRHAVPRRQLRVEYQPIAALPDGRPYALEALARWSHPQRGVVPPDEFIPVAERAGLIAEIGEWVLREAVQAAVRWEELAGLGHAPHVAVNVSAQQLSDPDFVYTVTRCLGEFGLAPERFILEVTESAVMDDVRAATETLHVLNGIGVQIALDDFGAGASSLGQLRQLSWIDILKIDRAFLRGLGSSHEDTAIVRTIIDLARALGMKVVAEGVEEREQADQLIALGCDHAQGWFFGRPLRPKAADAFVSSVDVVST